MEEGVAHEAKSVDGLCHLFNFHLLVLVLLCVCLDVFGHAEYFLLFT